MEQVIEYKSYQEYKQELDTELKKTAEGFVRIGYLLKVARDTSILAESRYENVVDFAKAEYGIDKTQVSRFIKINDKFSEGGYAPELKGEYQGFGYAKLSLMLSLPDSVNEELTPDYSKSEIQAIKDEVDGEKRTTEIELMLEEKDKVQQSFGTNLEKAVYQLGKVSPEIYKRLWQSAKEGEQGKHFIANLIPNGKAAYMLRIPGMGGYMLSIREEDDEVKLVNIREDNLKDRYTKQELETAVRKMFVDGESWEKSWEMLYGESIAEEKSAVAPVQPSKTAPRKESKVIVPKREEKTVPKPEENVPKSQKIEPKQEKSVLKPQEMTLHDVNPEISAPDPRPAEENMPEEKPEVQQEADKQIPGQDDIMNHPEYVPARKTDRQIIKDAKLTVDAVKLALNAWEYYIPRDVLENILSRIDYLHTSLRELRKDEK